MKKLGISLYRVTKYRWLILSALFGILFSLSCKGRSEKDTELNLQLPNNAFSRMSADNLMDFSWINEPEEYSFNGDTLQIIAQKESDFFINPEEHEPVGSGHFLFRELTGDFVATVQVIPDFSSMWNAGGLMLYIDERNWIKFVFENSDATGPTVVTVVTKNVSDDSNGAILNNAHFLWMKLIRKDNVYAMHWSEDGRSFKMARLCAMPAADTVKIGVEAQSPVGQLATHLFPYFNLEKIRVEDLRKGE